MVKTYWSLRHCENSGKFKKPMLLIKISRNCKNFSTLWGMEEYYLKQKSKQRDRMLRSTFDHRNVIDGVSDEAVLENALSLNIPFIR